MLELRGIHSYYGQAHILAEVSLTLAKGEIVVLVGRNGAGKSTTIKSIMGMVRVGAGSIAYDGEEILGQPPHRITRRGLGYVPEDSRVFARLSSEERRVGKECVSTCNIRRSPSHKKKKYTHK